MITLTGATSDTNSQKGRTKNQLLPKTPLRQLMKTSMGLFYQEMKLEHGYVITSSCLWNVITHQFLNFNGSEAGAP